jgi:hypothetical protein
MYVLLYLENNQQICYTTIIYFLKVSQGSPLKDALRIMIQQPKHIMKRFSWTVCQYYK